MTIQHSLVQVSRFGALYDLNLVVQVSSLRLYADDTTTYASDTNTSALELSLNQDLHELSSWFSSDYLSVNHSKTQAMILGNSSQELVLHQWRLHYRDNQLSEDSWYSVMLTISGLLRTTFQLF